jgi:hypothetical protein
MDLSIAQTFHYRAGGLDPSRPFSPGDKKGTSGRNSLAMDGIFIKKV